MSDTSSQTSHDHDHEDSGDKTSRSPSCASRRPVTPDNDSLRPKDADHSTDWPPSPSKSSESSQLSGDAAPFTPRKAASERGHKDKEPHNELRPVPAHDNPKPRQQPQPSPFTVLQVSDLHWFTSDADLVRAGVVANVPLSVRDITFLEHKCNGKSKGTAFIKCHSTEFMMRLLKWFETHEFQGKKVTAIVAPNVNGRPPIPPPTHDKDNTEHTMPSRGDTHMRAPLPFPPTNSHGGVNFNRVPLHHRQQVQQMQHAGFLNPSNNATKSTWPAVPTKYPKAKSFPEAPRKKMMVTHPIAYTTADPAIVWQQVPEYGRPTHWRTQI